MHGNKHYARNNKSTDLLSPWDGEKKNWTIILPPCHGFASNKYQSAIFQSPAPANRPINVFFLRLFRILGNWVIGDWVLGYWGIGDIFPNIPITKFPVPSFQISQSPHQCFSLRLFRILGDWVIGDWPRTIWFWAGYWDNWILGIISLISQSPSLQPCTVLEKIYKLNLILF